MQFKQVTQDILQKIEQLKEEIDRVSTTTEFNTKKLLNGDASGYWSTSDSAIEAIIKGSVSSGDYKVTTSISGGKSAVYKTHTFKVWDTTLSAYRTASASDSLTAIDTFLDNGRFILEDTQELTIYAGNGEATTITLGKGDTLKDLESKLENAMVELGLAKQGANASSTTTFVTAAGTGKLDSIEGSLVLTAGVAGQNSNLTFAGSESLLKALGFEKIAEEEESTVTVSIENLSTGETISTNKISKDGYIRNEIDGIDIKIDFTSTAIMSTDFDITSSGFTFGSLVSDEEYFLHIKDNTTKAMIGANEGQTIDLSIGRLDTVSMNIDNINITNVDDAERAATKLDMALEQINKTRSTVGAQMNRLEYTVANLNTSRENMTAAESRIRDLDIAQASSELAAQQVLMQSASAMLAQANLMPSYAIKLIQ